jgi:LysM repeat protein
MADNNIKCPVCGKVGIPDFHSEDVKCPCCGSDLSIYRKIDAISEDGNGLNIWKPISAVAIIAAAVLGVLLLTNKPQVSTSDMAEIAQLKDSISILNEQISQKSSVNTQYALDYKYVVRKRDSYWSISKKFYGVGTRAEEIAQNNGRTLDTPLHIGDTLKIK